MSLKVSIVIKKKSFNCNKKLDWFCANGAFIVPLLQYMAESGGGKYEPNPVFRLATWACKMGAP